MALTKVNTDLLEDGGKLDGIEAGADVTDTANVTAAGALMDSELTSEASVKALNQGVATTDSPTFAGLTTSGEITANGGIALGDGDVATFGDSDDLSIFHAGGTTYLTNTTGSLVLRTDSFRVLNTANSEQILHGDANGAVTAYYDNSVKLATTSTGIDVTGRAVVGSGSFDGGGVIHNYGSDGNSRSWWTKTDTHGYGDFAIRQSTTQTGSTYQTRLLIDSSGNVGVGTTSPSSFNYLSTSPHLVIGGGSSDAGVTCYSSTNGYGRLAFADGTNTTEQYRGLIQFYHGDNSMQFYTGSDERMRIDSSGNVGIGTSSPSYELDIQSSSGDAEVAITGSTTNNAVLKFENITNNTLADIYADNSKNLIFRTNGTTERMRIDSSGRVLVNTTADIGGARFNVEHTTDCIGCNLGPSASGTRYFIYFTYNGTNVGSITGTSTATAYNTSSDQRLKENIADADDAGNKIDAIQVRKFDWKVDGSHQDYGMIAQELQAVAPEAVSGDADSEKMMGVDYSKLVPMLIKEIQSLRNRVAQLEE